MPSPRPIQPMPSLDVALTLTGARERGGELALHRLPMLAEPRRLADDGRVDVRDVPADHPERPSAADRASRRRASARRPAGSAVPRSPSPAAPRRASITACVRTSASEWPSRPLLVLDLDPAEDKRGGPARSGAVVADADRRRHQPERLHRPARAPRRSRSARFPNPASSPRRRSYAWPMSPGTWASEESANDAPGVDEHLGERGPPGRSRRPACAGRRSRPRPHAGLGDRLDGGLVVEARIARRARGARCPRPSPGQGGRGSRRDPTAPPRPTISK